MKGTRIKAVTVGIDAILIIAAALVPAAQEPATVAERVRTTMLAQEPGWELEDGAVEEQRFWQKWKNRDESIVIE